MSFTEMYVCERERDRDSETETEMIALGLIGELWEGMQFASLIQGAVTNYTALKTLVNLTAFEVWDVSSANFALVSTRQTLHGDPGSSPKEVPNNYPFFGERNN